MSSITFDTLDATRRLRGAGFDEKQAETVVRVLSDAQSGLVTRQHFDAKLEQLDAKLEQLELRMIVKLGGLMVVAIGAVAALVKLA